MNLFQTPGMADMMFGQGLEAFIDVAKDWEGFEKFIPKLESFKETYLSKGLKTYTANRTEFGYNVLNHADFHLKNMLFKKNADGAIEDFYFVSVTMVVVTWHGTKFCGHRVQTFKTFNLA